MNRCPKCGHKLRLGEKPKTCPKCNYEFPKSPPENLGGATLVGGQSGFDIDGDADQGPGGFDPTGTLMASSNDDSSPFGVTPPQSDPNSDTTDGPASRSPQNIPAQQTLLDPDQAAAADDQAAPSAAGFRKGEQTIGAPSDGTHRDSTQGPVSGKSEPPSEVTQSGGEWGSAGFQVPPHDSEFDSKFATKDTHQPSEDSTSGSSATMDSSWLSSENLSGPSVSVNDSGYDMTLDSGPVNMDATQVGGSGARPGRGSSKDVKDLWGDFTDSNFGPMASLKSDSMEVGRSEGLVIRRRALLPSDAENAEQADYQILRYLGQGAMGVVFEAKQTAMQRDVAVKTLRPELARKGSDRQKFLYEASITGDLDHPNIVPIHDVGVNHDGTLFYSMKRVDGTPWQNVMQSKTRSENLDILMKVADAISFAHSRKVIHRDLKPENIMLGQFGEVLVMDWGLAVNLSRGKDFVLGGTPAYMAPEMARHQLPLIDHRSDVYLLGAMLFQIIAGYPPHPGETVTQCVAAAARNVIIPFKSSDELMNIAMKAMETLPDDRYRDVAEFQEAIRQYEEHAESIKLTDRADEELEFAISQGDYSGFSRARFGYEDAVKLWPENARAEKGLRHAKVAHAEEALARSDFDLGMSLLNENDPDDAELYTRLNQGKEERETQHKRAKAARQTAFIFLTVALGIAIVGAILFSMERDKANIAAENAIKAQEVALEEKREADKARAEAVKNEIEANEQRAKAEAATDDANKKSRALGEANENLEIEKANAQTAQAEAEEAREEAIASLKRAEASALEAATTALNSSKTLLESKQLEYSNVKSNLEVLQGRFRSDIRLSKSDLDDWNYEAIGPRLSDLLQSLGEDGNPYPISFKDWEAYRVLYRLRTASPGKTIEFPGIFDVAFSADGSRFAVALKSGDIQVHDASDAKVFQSFKIPFQDRLHPTCVALTSDGSMLIAGTSEPGENNLFYWDLATGQQVPLEPSFGHSGGTKDIQISDDDLTLTTNGADIKSPFKTVRVFQRETATGNFALSRAGTVNYQWNHKADVSPDGKRVLAVEDFNNSEFPGAERVCVIYLDKEKSPRADREPVILPFYRSDGFGNIYDAMFDPTSPDGSRVLLATDDGLVIRATIYTIPEANDRNPAERIVQPSQVIYERFEGHDPARPVLSLDAMVAEVDPGRPKQLVIVSGGESGDLIVWDTVNRKPRKKLIKHPGPIFDCGIIGDGVAVYSACDDNKIRIWKTIETRDNLELAAKLPPRVTSSADIISHDASSAEPWLAGVDRFGYVNVWSTDDAKLIGHMRVEQELGQPMSASFHAGSNRLVASTEDGVTRVWDTVKKRIDRSWSMPGGLGLFAASHNGRYVLQAYSDEATGEGFQIVDLGEPDPNKFVSRISWEEVDGVLQRTEIERKVSLIRNVQGIAISDDGQHLAFADGTRIYHFDREKNFTEVCTDPGEVFELEFLPNSHALLYSSSKKINALVPGNWNGGHSRLIVPITGYALEGREATRIQLLASSQNTEGEYRVLVVSQLTTPGLSAEDEEMRGEEWSFKVAHLPPVEEWPNDLNGLKASFPTAPAIFRRKQTIGDTAPSAVLSPNGDRVELLSADRQFYEWHVGGGEGFQANQDRGGRIQSLYGAFDKAQQWNGRPSAELPPFDHLSLLGNDLELLWGKGYAVLFDRANDKELFRVYPAGPARFVRFVPGTTDLVITHSDGVIRRWQASPTSEQGDSLGFQMVDHVEGDFRQAMPDAEGNLVILDAKGRLSYRGKRGSRVALQEEQQEPQRSVTAFDWLPSSSESEGFLVYGTREGHLGLLHQEGETFVDVTSGNEFELPVLGGDISAVSISLDGKYIAAGTDGGEVVLGVLLPREDAESTGQVGGIRTTRLMDALKSESEGVEGRRIASLQFSPTNQRLLVSRSKEATLWHIDDSDDKLISQMYRLSHIQTARVARFTPDGATIATAPANIGHVRLWPATPWSSKLHGDVDPAWEPSGPTIAQMIENASLAIDEARADVELASQKLDQLIKEQEERKAESGEALDESGDAEQDAAKKADESDPTQSLFANQEEESELALPLN